MGLANAPQQFQEMVGWVLRDVRVMGNSGTDAYMDDILVGTRVEEGEDLLEVHNQDLRRVLEVLKEHKLVADKKKCHLFVREVEFCGQVLANGTLRGLEKWERPRTITQLRGFLGFKNYYSIYIPDYANLVAGLQEKLKLPRAQAKKEAKPPSSETSMASGLLQPSRQRCAQSSSSKE